MNFIDFEKGFDSIDREVLWQVMKHYDMPDKLVWIIQNMYQGATCRVVHCGHCCQKQIELLTGGKQGCQLTPITFLLLIDWIMRETTNGRRMGIQWTMWDHLEDLDFADNIALLSQRFQQMQEKTTRLETGADLTSGHSCSGR